MVRTQGEEAARRWLLPPGSTVKPFVLAALLEARKLAPDEPFACPGALALAGKSYACSHPAIAQPMTVRTAIAYSCNCFVAQFALRMQSTDLSRALVEAGFQARPASVRLQALGEEGVLVTAVDLARAYLQLAEHAPEAVIEGLEDAVEYGTARLAASEREKIAGKTGTGSRHAWFAGFEPSRKPRYVVAVLVAGKSGGADAAPIGGKILRELCELPSSRR